MLFGKTNMQKTACLFVHFYEFSTDRTYSMRTLVLIEVEIQTLISTVNA